MRRKLATASWLVARSTSPWSFRPVAAAAVTPDHRQYAGGQRERRQEGHDGQLLDHAQRPAAAGRHGEDGQAVRGPDRRQGQRRGGRLGRPARPHPQRRRVGRGPRRDAGRHHPGAVLRGARRVREPPGPRRRHRRQGRLRARRVADDPARRARTARSPCRGSPRRARSTTARTSWRRPASIPRPPSPTSTPSSRRCRRSRTRSRRSAASRSRRSARRARRRSTSSTT